jgi:S-adenosylmethionine synthetase
MSSYVFTSESVSEGHPDKVCDYIADSILDAHLEQDKMSRVACEVLCKDRHVILAGEITSNAHVDFEAVARRAITEIGYVDSREPFHATGVSIQKLVSQQAADIAAAVSKGNEQGAGDQGLMFGYATNETPELMPLPILLAHRLASGLAHDRKNGVIPWGRPDAKTQVTVRYEAHRPIRVEAVVVSTQHWPGTEQSTICEYVWGTLLPRELGQWFQQDIEVLVNPSGEFAIGGPTADCGVTGRKIIVDTYGGFARHGGGAFSGKDPSKVDRSAAYFARYVARQVVKNSLAARAEIQVSYAIGKAKPVSTTVETFGTGDERGAEEFVLRFDFRPAAIIEQMQLLRPIYRHTTNYGHFGKPNLNWER